MWICTADNVSSRGMQRQWHLPAHTPFLGHCSLVPSSKSLCLYSEPTAHPSPLLLFSAFQAVPSVGAWTKAARNRWDQRQTSDLWGSPSLFNRDGPYWMLTNTTTVSLGIILGRKAKIESLVWFSFEVYFMMLPQAWSTLLSELRECWMSDCAIYRLRI